MQAPLIPDNEDDRIATLREMLVLDSDPEDRYDLITTYASSQFQVPMALVSLIDTSRQWFKSSCGLDAKETPREISFCGHAILQDDIFEITDTLLDKRFADNPLVTGEPKIRFYAGAPLIAQNGHKVGTLCLVDRKPRQLDEWERDHLKALARLVAMELQGQSAASDFAALQAATSSAAPGQKPHPA